MFRISLLLAVAILLWSCGNTSQSANNADNNASIPHTASDSVYKAVMDGHNEGMGKIGDIEKYTAVINRYKDSVGMKDAKMTASFDSVLQELSAAEEAMNKWMSDFDPDKAGTDEAGKLAFYKSEKEKIDSVTLKMEKSIEDAKKITGQ